MLHKVVKGYIVIAHEVGEDGLFWIIGSRRIGPGSYEYIVAGMRSFDLDNEWVTNGFYPTNIEAAFNRYHEKTAGY